MLLDDEPWTKLPTRRRIGKRLRCVVLFHDHFMVPCVLFGLVLATILDVDESFCCNGRVLTAADVEAQGGRAGHSVIWLSA